MRTLIPLAAIGLILTSLPSFAADTIFPPDSIVTQNVPPVPASVAESVGRYTEFRAASFSSWHPTRREMLIRTRFADTNQLHLVTMPLGARSQQTFFPDSVSSGSFDPVAGAYFVFNKDTGGNEFAQIYRQDFGRDPDFLAADRIREESGCVVRYERSFLRPVLDGDLNA